MSPKGRFDYMKAPPAPLSDPEQVLEAAPMKTATVPFAARQTELQTVARGTGRMQQNREQLNVRLPVALKRQAAARAALEGRTVGELIEALLLEYLNR